LRGENGRLRPPIFFGRHSGEHLLAVIPAKAGIHFDFSFRRFRENRFTSV
jgi:hypothetical protein